MTVPGTIFVVNALHSGGAEKQMLWIARTMAERGPVTIFELNETRGSSRIDSLIEEARAAGVRFVRSRSQGYLRAWFRLGRELRASPACHIWTWGMRADLCAFLWKLCGRNVVWICSLRNAHQQGIDSYAWLYRLFVSRVALFVANTYANCDLLVRVCPAAQPKCRVLPNVVRELEDAKMVSLPSVPPRPLRVAMLGNIDIRRKGYDTAIAVARAVLVQQLPVELHLAGRPDELDWLRTEIVRHRLDGVVHYHGEVVEPLKYLRRHDAFLLLSRFEGMPNAFLEALCVGLPAIATDVGDIARLAVEPRAYLLISSDQPDAAVAALKSLLIDWPATLEMAARGRAWCEAHCSETSCRRELFVICDELRVFTD